MPYTANLTAVLTLQLNLIPVLSILYVPVGEHEGRVSTHSIIASPTVEAGRRRMLPTMPSPETDSCTALPVRMGMMYTMWIAASMLATIGDVSGRGVGCKGGKPEF